MIILWVLLFVTMPVFAHKDLDTGLLNKVCQAVAMPFVAVKEHVENVGRGKQAIEYVEKSYEIITAQQGMLEKIVVEKEIANDAIDKLAKVHAERNDILGGALQVGQVVGTVYSVVYIGKAGIDLVSWIYHYFRPTQESILRKKLVEQELKVMEISAILNKCLSQNIDINNSFQGMPVQCESSARDFLQVAGKKRYNKVIKSLESQD